MSDLVSLFTGTFNDEDSLADWRRIFSFVFHFDGVPTKICSICKTQIDWIVGYHRQVFENDCYLRNEVVTEEMK